MKEVINFSSTIEPLEQVNPLISKFKINICSPDLAANKYKFSKEVIEGMFNTIRGAGVYGFYFEREGQLGGHEDDLVKTKNGYKRTGKPEALGFADPYVVPYWRTIDGIEWACTDIYLWTGRNQFLKNVLSDVVYHSMEVVLEEKPDGMGNKIVKDSLFLGFCLIQGTEPAFDGSKLLSADFTKFSKEVDMLKEELFSDQITNFPKQGDNKKISLRNSNFPQFDYEYAKNLKEKYPDIWSKGGNIRGNEAFEYWGKARDGETTDGVLDWIKEREAWSARHKNNKNIAGIIALVKWGTIGTRGEKYMKDLINKEKDKLEPKATFAQNIEIDNSKYSAVSGEWDNPGKDLYEPLMEAENAKSLLEEAYLIVEEGYEDAPSEHLKYPHHVIRDGKLVIHIDGLQAAFSRARQQGLTGEPIEHIKRHYEELELNMENFVKDGGEFAINSEQMIELFESKIKDLQMNCWVKAFDNEYIYIREYESYKTYRIKYMKSEEGIDFDMNTKEEVISGNYIPVSEVKFSSNEYADNIVYVDIQEKEAEENEKRANEVMGLKEELEATKAKLAEMEEEYLAYMAEVEELRKYKEDVMAKEKAFVVDSTITSVVGILPQEELDKCRESAESFTLENISSWKNEVQAMAFKFSRNINDKQEFARMDIPELHNNKKSKKGLWD